MHYCPNCGKSLLREGDLWHCKFCGYLGKESFTEEQISAALKKIAAPKTEEPKQVKRSNKKVLSILIALIWIILVAAILVLRG